jgi:hypothetical protein
MPSVTVARVGRAIILLMALMACACGRAPEAGAPGAMKEGAEGEWLDADGAGETALVYRLQAQVIDFTLVCRQADHSLIVAGANGAPVQAGDLAKLKLGSSEVEAPIIDAPELAGPGAIAVRVPVNPLVITALANANQVRLTYKDDSAETGVDKQGKLKAFAQTCSQLTNPG